MTEDETTEDATERRMRDVDHTPPDGEGARAVWERGDEKGPDATDDADAEADPERVGVADE
jgi:hypothetical protein